MKRLGISRLRDRRALLGAVLATVVAAKAQAARPARLLAGFETATAIIETSALSCLAIRVYLADSGPQQRQGLMRIEYLADDEGMLFRYRDPSIISMWMKNTYVPLDMLFISEDGRIATIVPRTTPMSTARITSTEPVTMVLELRAGAAEDLALETGNRLLAVD